MKLNVFCDGVVVLNHCFIISPYARPVLKQFAKARGFHLSEFAEASIEQGSTDDSDGHVEIVCEVEAERAVQPTLPKVESQRSHDDAGSFSVLTTSIDSLAVDNFVSVSSPQSLDRRKYRDPPIHSCGSIMSYSNSPSLSTHSINSQLFSTEGDSSGWSALDNENSRSQVTHQRPSSSPSHRLTTQPATVDRPLTASALSRRTYQSKGTEKVKSVRPSTAKTAVVAQQTRLSTTKAVTSPNSDNQTKSSPHVKSVPCRPPLPQFPQVPKNIIFFTPLSDRQRDLFVKYG